MQQKPSRWNVSPALIAPEAMDLWKGVAFVAPLWGGAGKGALLNALGQPLAGANLVAGSTLQWRGTPFGLGVGISGASNCLEQTNFAPITTSDGAGTGDFSMVCLMDPKAEARASIPCGQSIGASPYNWALFLVNSDWTGNAVSGQLSFSTYAATVSDVAANVAGAIDGKMHMFGGVRRGSEMRAYVDGVLRATKTGTVQDITSANVNFAIGNNPGATTYRIATDNEIVFAAGWNRALSNAEMRRLARDPFCMFRPAPEWRGVWTVLGGGGDTVLNPSGLTDISGFETPVFAQAHNLSAAKEAFASGLETPAVSQTHNMIAADALFAEIFEAPALSPGGVLIPDRCLFPAGIETPVLLQTHILSAAEAMFAEVFGAAGISQAHLLFAAEMNSSLLFDLPLLAMNSQGTPGFRMRPVDHSARSKSVLSDSRSKSITE